MELTQALVLVAALQGAYETDKVALAGEMSRFPHPDVVSQYQSIANGYLTYLQSRQWIDRDICPWIDDLVEDQVLVTKAYGNLQFARCCYLHESRRREAGELRKLIGWENYVLGRMPAPLPCMEQPKEQPSR